MTREEAIKMAKADLKCMERDTSGQDEMCNSHKCDECSLNYERGNMGEQKEWLRMAIQALEQEPCDVPDTNVGDIISKQTVLDTISELNAVSFYEAQEDSRETYYEIRQAIKDLSPVKQEPNTGQYEKHIDHTDCIWYGNDSGCPVTCSQYRDGWNDAMDYIFKNGKGYQPYRHDG